MGVEVKRNYPSTFFSFSKLPPELRNMIWRHTLDRDEGLVLYPYKKGYWCPRLASTPDDDGFDPIHPEINVVFEFRPDLYRVRIEVPVAFVNTEARRNAIAWAQEQHPRILTYFEGYGPNQYEPIFLRAFNSDHDALYVAPGQLGDFIREESDTQFAREKEISSPFKRFHIAMPESLVRDEAVELPKILDYYGLARLYIIVGALPSIVPYHTYSDAAERLYECKASQRVALWTDFHWEFDFTAGICASNEFRRLVESAADGLGESLEGYGNEDGCEIHSTFLVKTGGIKFAVRYNTD